MIELRAVFKGKVQGVGFRWTVVDVAEKIGIVGSVKNLPNGTVEVVAHGTKEDLEKFLKEINQNTGAARIEKVDCRYSKPTGSYFEFKIG